MSDDFDPDAYLAKKKAEDDFDPDAYLAKAVGADKGSPLDKAMREQSGDIVTVETPTGPAKFTREGKRFYDGAEAKELFGKSMENSLDRGLKESSLSFLSGGGRLMDEMGGAIKAAKSFPEWLQGRANLGDEYRSGRDSIRSEVAHSTERSSPQVSIPFTDTQVPLLPMLGAALPTAVAPLPAGVLARLGLGVEQGAQSALETSEADLTQGNFGGAARDVGVGVGAGLAFTGVGEGIGAAARGIGSGALGRVAGVRGTQGAKDAAAVADELASMQGKVRSEKQVASRLFENTQRAAGGGVAPSGQSPIDPALQSRALMTLSDPDTVRLQSMVLENSMDRIPAQTALVNRLEQEAAQKAAGASAEAAKRTRDYFAQPVMQTEITPRLGRLAFNAGTGAMTGAAGGAALGMGSMLSGIGDPLTAAGVGLATGITQGLGKSAITMTRNAMKSPRLQAAALQSVALGSRDVAQGAQRAMSVAGPAAQVAKENAYRALMERFGITAKSSKELADEAFLKGQIDPALQAD